MMSTLTTAISFLVGLVVSGIIIYIVTKLFGEKEGLVRAFITAIIGAVVYSITYFLLGNGIWAAIVGGIVWLLALRALYDIGWLKAFLIAIVVWIVTAIAGILLPTLPGPI
jgi:hypothetical protein